MSTARNDLRDAAADLTVELYGEWGDTCSYTTQDQPPITYTGLVCSFPQVTAVVQDELGMTVQELSKTFFVPRQTNFPPPSPPQINDILTHDGKDWSVQTWNLKGSAAIYELTAIFVHAISLGDK